jgi:acetyl-CoA C-acetyltransferase
MGAFQGSLSGLKASQLGATVVGAAVERAGVANDGVDLVLMGNVLPAGMGQAPARQAAIYAGLDRGTSAVTLNKMCGSGLEAVIQGARAVALGDAGLVVAGGMESMTNAPYLLPGARGGLRINDGAVVDSMVHDGLWDAYNDMHMGNCAEMCAREYDFGREQQDAFAAESYRRALAAMQSGAFADELVPVEVPARRGRTVPVSEDEGPGKVDFEKMPNLRPVFEEGGTVTAANASTINDGAAALIVTSLERAEAEGMTPLARIVGYSAHAQAPEWFTTAPIGAMEALYRRLGWAPDEVDLYEINEAYSVVTMAAMERFELPHERVNVRGGAVALGHPIGASGARILVTLLHALRARGGGRGVASICIGGGEALAMGVETL